MWVLRPLAQRRSSGSGRTSSPSPPSCCANVGPPAAFMAAAHISSDFANNGLEKGTTFAPRRSRARAASTWPSRTAAETASRPLPATSRTRRPSRETRAGSPAGAFGPASTWSSGQRSAALRVMGPVARSSSPAAAPPAICGNCPAFGTRCGDGLCPKTPQKNAGIRMEPPTSLPRPNGAAPAATIAPSPPELPPTMRVGS